MSTKDRMRSNGNAGEKNAAAAAAGTRLDPWYNTYADRALGMKQSEVRSSSQSPTVPRLFLLRAACRTSLASPSISSPI